MRGGRRKRKEKEGWYKKQVYKNGDKREKGKKIKRERMKERKNNYYFSQERHEINETSS